MLALAAQALLALILAAWLQSMLRSHDEPSPVRRAATFLLLAALAARSLGWCWAARAASPWELIAPLARGELTLRFASCAWLGLAALLSIRRSLAPMGLILGLLFALLGSQAFAAMRLLQAWRVMGGFGGTFFMPLVPLALAASMAAMAFTVGHPSMGARRWQAACALLLAWTIPVRAGLWRLSHRATGVASLSAEAALAPASAAKRVGLVWLFPLRGQGYHFEEKRAVAAGVDISPENLEKIEAYLRRWDFRGVFARQALAALRQGWHFWWEADRALDMAILHRPGLFPPDYKGALGLLRAGPMTEERYRQLLSLNESARPRKEGFEDVNTSQLIFEGFASAFARFGDEDPAREWLFRVDDLWPIYDKKIEVSPLETEHEGVVEGRVLVDGKPAPDLKVGLFLAVSSAPASNPGGWLSQSGFPDERGLFRFDSLAPGIYYLGLMDPDGALRGRVLNAPGLIELTPESPALSLDPIRIEK